MSYIVKNCPGLRGWVCNEQFVATDKMIDCKELFDCKMKKIIRVCQHTVSEVEWLLNDSGDWYDECVHGVLKNIKNMNEEILKKLEIEEVK